MRFSKNGGVGTPSELKQVSWSDNYRLPSLNALTPQQLLLQHGQGVMIRMPAPPVKKFLDRGIFPDLSEA